MTERERLVDVLAKSDVPVHLCGGLVRYIVDHVRTGDFLLACLENDLSNAYRRADDVSRERIGALVAFLWWEAPADCWGSVEKVKAWLGGRHDQSGTPAVGEDAGA